MNKEQSEELLKERHILAVEERKQFGKDNGYDVVVEYSSIEEVNKLEGGAVCYQRIADGVTESSLGETSAKPFKRPKSLLPNLVPYQNHYKDPLNAMEYHNATYLTNLMFVCKDKEDGKACERLFKTEYKFGIHYKGEGRLSITRRHVTKRYKQLLKDGEITKEEWSNGYSLIWPYLFPRGSETGGIPVRAAEHIEGDEIFDDSLFRDVGRPLLDKVFGGYFVPPKRK